MPAYLAEAARRGRVLDAERRLEANGHVVVASHGGSGCGEMGAAVCGECELRAFTLLGVRRMRSPGGP
jgi:hypothetical protein